MRYITLCSGIECVSVAAAGLGWEPVCFSEIEPFPSAVLAHHYPDVPNVGDMAFHDWRQYRGKCDAIIAGTPCQAFSVAGRRESLADARGNLTLKFAEICDDVQPDVIVWENVPGVLSAKDNAFGCLLGALAGEDAAILPDGKWTNAGLVAGPERLIAWRVLDAQFFGVAQRRRRVFLVASPRTGRIDPAKILFESDGVRRDYPPCRSAPEGVAVGTGSGASGGGEWRGEGSIVRTVSAKWSKGSGGPAGDECQNLVAGTLGGGSGNRGWCNDMDRCGAFVVHSLRGEGFDASEDGTGRGTPLTPVAFRQNQMGEVFTDEVMGTLNTNSNSSGRNTAMAMTGMAVRRLTPRECERLQGLPDDYTRIPWRGKPPADCPDGPRYKAIGNGMAVSVVRWILERIDDAQYKRTPHPHGR